MLIKSSAIACLALGLSSVMACAQEPRSPKTSSSKSPASIANLEALRVLTAWATSFDEAAYPLMKGLNLRIASANAWVAQQRPAIVASMERLDPANVSAGFRMEFLPRNSPALPDVNAARKRSPERLIFTSKDAKPDHFWVLQFLNYLSGGYTVLIDADRAKVVVVLSNPEG
jgi:hypothetical protein